MKAVAQSPYLIKINEQEMRSDSGFLEMGTNKAANGDVLSYNNVYLTKNNRPWYPVMGEMHFARCAAKDWESSILKMKSCGIQVISTYVFWNYTEEKEGFFNWSGNNDLRAFLALCKKHNLYVWLRPGPWVHAELRNGGFPDWLLKKKIGLRKNDSTYVAYVNRFFKQIALQCSGYWFKQNGTVIGVQIENELDFRNREAFNHMLTVKNLAIGAGMDVPYYSAFGQGPDNQTAFMYMMGSYPDSPWGQHTKKLIKPVFFIKPLEADRDIGSDLIGKVDGKVRNTYPKLSAEIGGGMQVTYHRRVEVSAADIAANAFTKIASGLNGIGYYMFRGGLNPTGATSLQESRSTGYPNDVPLINYDFQSPIGSTGILNDTYDELRLQHMFISDFGSALVAMPAYFPEGRKNLSTSTDTVQSSARITGNSGFIFLSNYQRHINMPAVKNFNIGIKGENSISYVPETPVTIRANSYVIWPYNLKIGSAVLHYATAQPLCVLHNGGHLTYVFFSEDSAEFAFTRGTVKNIKRINNNGIYHHDKVFCPRNKPSFFDVTDQGGTTARIILLTKAQALQSFKVKLKNKEVLMISSGSVVADNNVLSVEKTGDSAVKIKTFPQIRLKPASALFTAVSGHADGVFSDYRLTPVKTVTGGVSMTENKTRYDTIGAALYSDSLLKQYARHKTFKKTQPGPLYQLHFHDLPGQKKYTIQFEVNYTDLITDWEATMVYDADLLALYKDSRLLYDQFNYNDTCKMRLGCFLQKPGEKLQVQLLPLPAGADVYVEDQMKDMRDWLWQMPVLNRITLKPVYTYHLLTEQ